MNFNVEDVAQRIGAPVDRWAGNCHAIASLMIANGLFADWPMHPDTKPKARYGHWLGPVAPDTTFSNRPVVPHGWVEIPSNSLPGGLIVDPTRWYFEGREPYIYVGTSDYYDIGGRQLRNSMHDEIPPACTKGNGQFKYPENPDLEAAVKALLMCNCAENKMNIDQLFWMGNLDPDLMDSYVRDIYLWLDKIGQKSVIPIDYWKLFMTD